MFNRSLDYIVTAQQELSALAITIWPMYTDTIKLLLVAPILVNLVGFGARAKAFYFAVVVSALYFVKITMKVMYHDPRPFWVSTEI